MNGALLLIVGIVFFALAYVFYGRYLVRLFGVDAARPTPAHTQRDGVDYVPTRAPVLFGHHFASIAGAGPIVGPVLAAYLGWGPVVLWVLFGCVTIGAMHDFAALTLSVRHGGRSIGNVIEDQLGFGGRLLFLVFCWAALILVVAIFAILVAKTFVNTPAVATASLLFIAMAPVFGYCIYRKNVSILTGSLVCVPLLFGFIWVGTQVPIDLVAMGMSPRHAQQAWLAVLLVYVSIASVAPVWILLQPRDYLNSYLLYAMLGLGILGIFVVAPRFQLPAFTGWSATTPQGGVGHLFPLLFVTVACGACSGFHALVASGTTAKQLNSEADIKPIGYGAMLIEGLVALMAVTSVAVLSKGDYLAVLKNGSPVDAFASGLAGFTVRLGLGAEVGRTFFALAISAFLLTTLDTATRLARFCWQELFLPRAGNAPTDAQPAWQRVAAHAVPATLMVVLVAGYLAYSGNAGQIWPVFGASNQLLAALTLLVVTLVLVRRRANFWVALIPMLFMSTITVWALVELLQSNYGKPGATALVVATAFLLALAAILAVQSVMSLRRPKPASEGD